MGWPRFWFRILFRLRLAIRIWMAPIYVCIMGQLIYHHGMQCYRGFKANELVKVWSVRIPAYLTQWQGSRPVLTNAPYAESRG